MDFMTHGVNEAQTQNLVHSHNVCQSQDFYLLMSVTNFTKPGHGTVLPPIQTNYTAQRKPSWSPSTLWASSSQGSEQLSGPLSHLPTPSPRYEYPSPPAPNQQYLPEQLPYFDNQHTATQNRSHASSTSPSNRESPGEGSAGSWNRRLRTGISKSKPALLGKKRQQFNPDAGPIGPRGQPYRPEIEEERDEIGKLTAAAAKERSRIGQSQYFARRKQAEKTKKMGVIAKPIIPTPGLVVSNP